MIKLLIGLVFFFETLHSHAFVFHGPTSRQEGQQIRLLSFSVEEHASITSGERRESFMDKLFDRLHRSEKSPIVVEGYVTSKRKIGKNLTFLDFQVDHDSYIKGSENHNLCVALLRKDIYTGSFHDGYRRCLLKGCKFRITGVVSPTKIPGNVVLMLHSMELLALPRQVQHIKIILQQGVNGAIPLKEVVAACSVSEQNNKNKELLSNFEERLLSLNAYQSNDSTKNDIENEKGNNHDSMIEFERQKFISQHLSTLAKDIFRSLPDDPHYPLAADQKALSKAGNFMLHPAPKKWQTVPKQLRRDAASFKTNKYNSTTSNGVSEFVMKMTSLARSKGGIQSDQKSARVSITGWVQNRRRFQENITMVYITDSLKHSYEEQEISDRLPCLIHPDVLSSEKCSGIYRNLISSGSKVHVEGQVFFPKRTEVIGKDHDSLLFWVQDIRLVRSSHSIISIRYLLDMLYQKQIDPREAAEALHISLEDTEELSFLSDATQRQWKANSLSIQLQKESSSGMNSKRIDPELLKVMSKYRYLSKIHPVIETDIGAAKSENGLFGIRESSEKNSYSRVPNKRPPLSMPGSKWQIKKRPQIEWMGRQIREVLESHPDFKKRKLTILDIGGGRGRLANYLGQTLGQHVQIHVVDISQGAVTNGKRKAKRLQLPVEFQFADASNSKLLDAVDADVVVALHACGHLSDIALNHAIHRQAGFVIVPCCFNSNSHLMIPSNSIGSDKNASLTPVPDWLGLPANDWSALKLIAEFQHNIPLASEAIGILCAVRAEAVKKKMLMAIHKIASDENCTVNVDLQRQIKIKSFPIQYSTRNAVLVGKCN